MHNSMAVHFFCYRPEILFWSRFGPKSNVVRVRSKLVPRKVKSLLSFSTGNALLDKFDPKNQNYQFKLKFGT